MKIGNDPRETERILTEISRTRALTERESLSLEWAIKEQLRARAATPRTRRQYREARA